MRECTTISIASRPHKIPPYLRCVDSLSEDEAISACASLLSLRATGLDNIVEKPLFSSRMAAAMLSAPVSCSNKVGASQKAFSGLPGN